MLCRDQHGDGVRLCIGGLVGVYSGLVQLYSMAYEYWPALRSVVAVEGTCSVRPVLQTPERFAHGVLYRLRESTVDSHNGIVLVESFPTVPGSHDSDE
jgi:hypothetical protein